MHEIDTMIIGGTEAYNLKGEAFGKILDEVVLSTPFGSSAPIRILDLGECKAGLLSRHGEAGYQTSAPFVNYRANIYAAKELGAQRVISWNGAGAINRMICPGDYVILDDYVDLTKKRDYTFYPGRGYGFIRQSPAFCPELRLALYRAARAVEPRTFDVGVYACTEGPRLETETEIRMYAQAGADVVGMTIVPEVLLAKELEMCYASITYISNFAEGVRPAASSTNNVFASLLPGEFLEQMKASTRRFAEIIPAAITSLGRERKCACGHFMDVYKKRGDIGEDWHGWVAT
jgi:5'-methylthioadenosine phosphorylase